MDQRSKLKAVIQEEVKQELKEIFGLFGKGSTEKFAQDSEDAPPPVEKFSLLALKQLGSSKEIRDYVRRTLPFLKKGQARAAYAIDDTKIIKIALSDNKTYQNKNEVENSRCLGPKVAVQVLSFHPTYVWIVEERLKPITSSAEITAKFNQLNNLDGQELMFVDAADIRNFLADMPSLLRGRSDFAEYQKRHNLLMSTSPWYQELVSKLRGCQVASWDFHKDNWGIRPSTGELVLLDIGFGRTEVSTEQTSLKELFNWFNKQTSPFSIENLKKQKTLKKVTQYLESVFPGAKTFQGASRKVWIIDEARIIKVAKKDSGAKENRNEIENAKCLGEQYAPRIFEFDQVNFFWVIEERLEQPDEEQLYNKLEHTIGYRPRTWMELSKFMVFSVVGSINDQEMAAKFKKILATIYPSNQWFTSLVNHLRKCNVGSHDFHNDNWGIRPSTGELVLLDLGFVMKQQAPTLMEFYNWITEDKSKKEFSLEHLRSLRSFNEIENYVYGTLGKPTGHGGYRKIFLISNDVVLKLVFGDSIAYQNAKEVENAKCLGERYAVKVFEAGFGDYWLLEERVEVFKNPESFVQHFNQTTNSEFQTDREIASFIELSVRKATGRKIDNRLISLWYEKLYQKGTWFAGLIDGLVGCETDAFDFHWKNWGIRTSTGELVMLDLGF